MPTDLGLVSAMLDPTLTVGECETEASAAGVRPGDTGYDPDLPGLKLLGDGVEPFTFPEGRDRFDSSRDIDRSRLW